MTEKTQRDHEAAHKSLGAIRAILGCQPGEEPGRVVTVKSVAKAWRTLDVSAIAQAIHNSEEGRTPEGIECIIRQHMNDTIFTAITDAMFPLGGNHDRSPVE